MGYDKIGDETGTTGGQTRTQRQDDLKDNSIVTLFCVQVNQHLQLLVPSPSCMRPSY